MIEKKEYIGIIRKDILKCDICGKEVRSQYCGKQCYICGRDVCSECSYLFESYCNLETPSYDGDHPDSICHECWDKGKEYRERIQEQRDYAERKEQELWKLWKEIRIAEIEKAKKE
jgi:hypothetical protein